MKLMKYLCIQIFLYIQQIMQKLCFIFRYFKIIKIAPTTDTLHSKVKCILKGVNTYT